MELYFEVNNTDGDIGFHGLIDGEGWTHLEVDNPLGREIMDLKLDGGLKAQTLTELFFESSEPTFDVLDPVAFFQRFIEGEYEVEAETSDGPDLSSTATVTHLLPAPVSNVTVNGLQLPEDTDNCLSREAMLPFTISWDPVTLSHPVLGRTGEPVEVENYEVVMEGEGDNEFTITHLLPADVNSIPISEIPADSGDLIKLEVLVSEESGNQVAVESCFTLR